MKNLLKLFLLLFIFGIILSSCKQSKKEDPKPEVPITKGAGDEENITRVELHLIDSSNTSSFYIVKYNDPDGDNGSKPAVVDSLKLKSNKTYFIEVRIYDDTKSPSTNISNEIKEESNFHYFHYNYTATNGTATVKNTILDKDSQSPAMELGLEFKLKTGSGTGKGNFNVSLRHFANGAIKSSDPKGGEQDILLDFPTSITL